MEHAWRRGTWLVALAACSTPPEGEVRDPPTGPSLPDPIEVTETDGAGAEDDTPGDTLEGLETDASDSDDDPGPPPVTLPTSFGGVFTELATPVWTVESDWQALFYDDFNTSPAVLGDLDHDGVDEVVVITAQEGVAPSRYSPLLRYDRQAGSLTLDADTPRPLYHPFAPGLQAIVDLDGDGLDDAIRPTIDGLIALGRPDGSWAEVGVVVARYPGRVAGLERAALYDLDADGWLDVVASHSNCNVDGPALTLLHRTGLRTWRERDDPFPSRTKAGGWSMGVVPLRGTEPTVVLMAHDCGRVNEHPGTLRPVGETSDGVPVFGEVDLVPDDAWYRLMPATAGFPLTRLEPMGAAVADFDNDGRFEITVSVADFLQPVFREVGGDRWEDLTGPSWLWFPKLANTTERQAWGQMPIDIDLDGYVDLLIAQGDDAVANQFPLDTRESYVRLFWNDRQGGFHDVSDRVGLDAVKGNWHSVVLGDLDDDGDPDLLVGGYGFLPRVWRNDLHPPGRQLHLRLRGTTSNHLGVGATVVVQSPGLPSQRRMLGEGINKGPTADPELFIAVGSDPSRVDVTWPTGIVQVYDGVAAGAVLLEEAPVVTLSEPDRHLPADGVARLEVVVTPRDPAGVGRAAAVQIEESIGDATWAGPAVQDGLAWRRTLTAPTVAGVSVIEVEIDGVPVAIRPRVWWDP